MHRPNGPWADHGGYEYTVVLMAALFAITAERQGLATALGALAAGVGGSTAVIAAGGRAEARGETAPG